MLEQLAELACQVGTIEHEHVDARDRACVQEHRRSEVHQRILQLELCERAATLHKSGPMKTMQVEAMEAADKYSWANSAKQYVEVLVC